MRMPARGAPELTVVEAAIAREQAAWKERPIPEAPGDRRYAEIMQQLGLA